MSFNPDPSKQAQEIIFSRKKMKSSHPSVYFNNIPVSSTSVHKHLGMLLDDKLSYEHHLKFGHTLQSGPGPRPGPSEKANPIPKFTVSVKDSFLTNLRVLI